MRFSLKFLLSLLGFSLVPLLLVSTINLRSLHRQGKAFATTARDELAEIVRDELHYSVQEYAQSLQLGERSLIFALSLLVEHVSDVIEDEVPATRRADIYLSRDFSDSNLAPQDLAPSPRLYSLTKEGTRNLTRFSQQHPAMLLPLHVDPKNPVIARDLAALAGIRPFARSIAKNLGTSSFRQFVCLENGICSVYPGHGGFPVDYDCRATAWYREALQNTEPVWSGPFNDPALGGSIYMLTTAIHADNGRLLGVAALDYPLKHILQEQQLGTQWSDKARSYLVGLETDPKTGKTGFIVLAKRAYHDEALPVSETEDYAWLRPDNPAETAALITQMKAANSDVAELTMNGEQQIWAFSRYGVMEGLDIFLILTVPKNVYMELPDTFSRQALDLIRSQGLVAFGALLVVSLLVILVAIYGARSVTRPLLEISGAARRLSQGDFSVHLDLKLGDERSELVRVINELGPRLAHYMDMQQAMLVAEEVQRSLLPAGAPQLPGYDISGTSIYCDETGGDYYDFLMEHTSEGSDHCSVIVGDVSGHGIPSALLMATARALLRGLMILPLSLAERVGLVNKMLTEDLSGTGRFMTMYIIEIAPEKNLVRWVRAGHDPALFYHPDTQKFTELAGQGIPLGVLDDYVYNQYSADFNKPGSILVIGTDGIWETVAPDSVGHDDMFGKQRLQDVIRTHAHLAARDIQNAVLDAVNDYRGGGRQADDITLTVIKKA